MSRRPRGRGRKPQHNNNKSNNPNRALDSNGPDVRVRGSAKTIYDKYMSLAHDASVSGRRVKAESYYQHAEHYLRIVQELAEAAEKKAEQQRLANEKREAEQAARRAEHEKRAAKNKKSDENKDAKSEDQNSDKEQDSDKADSRSRSHLNRRRNGKSSGTPEQDGKEGEGETVKVAKKKRVPKKPKAEEEVTAAE